jgi:enoyl-[acyl-carrier protein] reductase II
MADFANRVTSLFNIQYPIIQGGMVWNSGWRLASAVSEAGGLGVIGAGSMNKELLREHIQQCKKATSKPFGVNLPLLYSDVQSQIDVLIEEEVKIVFTSAGNPALWTALLKEKGMTVVHVVSSSKFAKKAEQAGCDAVVAEGFEAGGHNGREETTTLVLIPAVCNAVAIPVIAAGGIATGKQMFAVMSLGAAGVQMGTRFVASVEGAGHASFKEKVIQLNEGDTQLSMKKLTPVRLIKNEFYQRVADAEKVGADAETLKEILGKGRAKKGMFEGDLIEGELEIGQASCLVKEILPVKTIIENTWAEFNSTLNNPLA